MTTQSEHQQPDQQQYDEPQPYNDQQAAPPAPPAEPAFAEPQRPPAHPGDQPWEQDAEPASSGQNYGMTTEHLAGATAGGAASTQQFADAQAPEPAAPAADNTTGHTPLFPDDERDSINDRWKQIQSTFVDEPRQAVQEADELVAELMQQLARMFADERGQLESQWAQGTDVSTEDLRQGLQRYREFFQRLLAA